MVTRDGWVMLTLGLAIGVPIGIAASRLFKSMLFGVSSSDPLSIASAILALTAICVVAATIPVRRATRVDPIVALRYE